ncbi:alpha/beta hydrolase [Kitasatospora sp. NPDC058162]|uniref:alpha/beta hydrolase n=1 Tax=Kitasatospora sp. NPDC058162 TaxID=3346362 RepID=UPI0036DF32A4
MGTRLTRRLAAGCTALACTALALAAAPVAVAHADTTTAHRTGTLADGATWVADIPADWNGTLLLFSHGFGPTQAGDAPSSAAATALLAEGYALVGSSYDPYGSWWALDSAERDQFQTIDAFTAAVGRPARTISVGLSMGGLVNAQIARDADGRVAGALGLCGLVAGGVDLNNYQLAAETVLATLLAPGDRLSLTDYPSQAAAAATATTLTEAVKAAQTTPQGRARIALAAAYLNLPAWAPGKNPPAADDPAGQEAQQYDWLAAGQLDFIITGRYSIEQAAGGDSGSTVGLNWKYLLASSPHHAEVRALYRAAGLDLDEDLATLRAVPAHQADPAATRRMERSSTAGQGLDVPLLDLHTTADQLIPVEQENAFAARVRAAGDGALLRQAYVARQGHCSFTSDEILAGLHALVRRIDTGHWGDTGAAALNADRPAGTTAFVSYRPGRLVTR